MFIMPFTQTDFDVGFFMFDEMNAKKNRQPSGYRYKN
jgi:hypothetical protein